jgi:ABC-type transporter Mla MlaB component
MTKLKTILEQASVQRVLIVDDAYDNIPLASDLLALDTDGWTSFFEDVTDEDEAVLRDIFNDYDNYRADELPMSDVFVAALWNNKTRFRDQLTEPVFGRYLIDSAADMRHLDTLEEQLTGFGLLCTTVGRQFHEQVATSDIIFIDLFLGSAQNDEAVNTSINELHSAINKRLARPPMVILMSRSSRLKAKKQEFRDRSGLFESAFRIIQKSEVGENGQLQRILYRLAKHYNDSLKLAEFLHAWQVGLQKASQRTANLIRALDLSDHAQIQQLLLSAEGEPTGSYLVDVFDRVLQHEIECEAAIIDAAMKLNELNTDIYPPPYIAGSRDLQALMYCSLFQNRQRLRLRGAEGSRVAFGDLIRRKEQKAQNETVAQDLKVLSGIDSSHVMAVLTPACDLQRQGAKRIFLLVGSLQQLTAKDWIYKEDPFRTPVIEIDSDNRFWIKWDLKHIETISHEELEQALDYPTGFEIIARLRESHALEIQQRLLSNLGRVGQIAQIPATFAMRVEAYVCGLDKKPSPLNIPILLEADGVCYVGRNGSKDMRLILPEDACDGICQELLALNLGAVHADAHKAIEYLRQTDELMAALTKGITLPGFDANNLKDIPSPSGESEGNGGNQKILTIGWVGRKQCVEGLTLTNSHIQKAGIILSVQDINDSTEMLV